MSQDEFERIQPAAVDIGATAARAEPARHDGVKLPGAALLLAALVALAAAVIFVLPDIVARRSAQPVATTPQAGPAAAGSATAGGAAPAPSPALSSQGAPYAQAQAERERAAAKSALDALLATQYELQQRGVEKWAAAEFAAATALARAGDEAYRSGSFAAAETGYREGQQAMQALLDGVAARLQDRLARGDAALAPDDAATATALFTEALAIEAGNPRAQRGLARAEARGTFPMNDQRARGRTNSALFLEFTSDASLDRGDTVEARNSHDHNIHGSKAAHNRMKNWGPIPTTHNREVAAAQRSNGPREAHRLLQPFLSPVPHSPRFALLYSDN